MHLKALKIDAMAKRTGFSSIEAIRLHLAHLRKRAQEMDPDHIRQGSENWAELITLVRAEIWLER